MQTINGRANVSDFVDCLVFRTEAIHFLNETEKINDRNFGVTKKEWKNLNFESNTFFTERNN